MTRILIIFLKEKKYLYLELKKPEVTASHEGIITNGTTVILNCINNDPAKPTLTWVDKFGTMVSHENILTLKAITKNMTSSYRCKSFKEKEIIYSRSVFINVTCKLFLLNLFVLLLYFE